VEFTFPDQPTSSAGPSTCDRRPHEPRATPLDAAAYARRTPSGTSDDTAWARTGLRGARQVRRTGSPLFPRAADYCFHATRRRWHLRAVRCSHRASGPCCSQAGERPASWRDKPSRPSHLAPYMREAAAVCATIRAAGRPSLVTTVLGNKRLGPSQIRSTAGCVGLSSAAWRSASSFCWARVVALSIVPSVGDRYPLGTRDARGASGSGAQGDRVYAPTARTARPVGGGERQVRP